MRTGQDRRRFLIRAKVIGSQRPFDTDVTFKYTIHS